ncbi:MAG: hypothetical protein Q4A06_00035 [Cardiobacteriaceae bacterium]|nr:hypothetical protein [Cardiobacteriaceae bacterium]
MNDLQQGFTQRMRLLDAWKENPDKAAELRRIARETGVPQGLVDDDVIAGHRLHGVEQQLSGLKALPAAIRNSQTFATLAQDDMPTLASIEQLSQARKRLEEAKQREAELNRPGFMSGTLSEIGLNLKKIPAAMAQNRNDQQIENLRYTMQTLDAQGSLTPEMKTFYEREMARYGGQFEEAKAEVARINAEIHALRPKDMHWAQEIIRGAVTSAPNTLAALGITLATRNPAAGAMALGATVSETSTADARLEGLGFDDAQRKGMIDGAAETLFEVMPLGRMMALYRRGGGDVAQSALKQLGKATVSDMLGENATQFVQDMNNVMHGLDQELQDAIDRHGFFSPEVLKIQGERQLIATGTSALMSGAMGSPAVVMDVMNNRERMAGDIAKNMQQEQEQDLQNLADISKAVQDSKLRERAPEIFADLAHDIAANADHPHLYLDANALHQSGLMDVIADAVPELATPMQEAAEAGGAVQIPLADYLAKIAPDAGLVASLAEHVRFEPEGLSLAEITHHAAAELEADIEARAQEMAAAEALDAEVQTVKQNILDQLNAVGRFTPEVNEKQATLAAAAYETWAARLHTTPQELFARHPLRIIGESAEGGLNQALAEHPPRGWQHSDNPQDAIRIWTEDGREAAKNEAVFWTLDNAADTGIPGTAGYSHSVSRSAAHHMYTEHGNHETEAARGQIAVTAEDLARIPEIVTSPDDIVTGFQSEQGAERVAYLKRFDDALVVYVAEASRKKKDFRAISMRKYPPTAKSENIAKNISSQSLNVRNGEGAYADDNALFQNSQEEREFAATAEQYGGEATYEAAKSAGDTELTYRQWVQVRTPAFKAWFGDWEHDPDNASKVINEKTGEPLVVYHGTIEDFDAFDPEMQGSRATSEPAFFFALKPEIANEYAIGDGGNVFPVFLSLKNPLQISQEDYGNSGAYNKILHYNFVIDAIEGDNDGLIFYDIWDNGGVDNQYAVFNPNQIKSATANTGAFSPDNDSILYQSYRRNNRDVPYNDAPHMMFADDKYSIEHYGDKLWVLDDDAGNRINASSEEFRSAMRAWIEDNMHNLRDAGYFYGEDAESFIEQLLDESNPEDIVDSAGFWDIGENWILNSVWEDVFEPHGWNVLETSDGAIVFDPDVVRAATEEEAEVYYQSHPQSPRGAFLPDSNTIVLTENADLSTFQHELGHFYLESMVGFANDLRHVDTLSGGGTLSETEKQMLRDVDILMDWFGLDLETWNRMTLEEKRPYHEQQARGFEAYLMEGKAPSLELEGVFARMLTWFLHLYKKLTALDVELSDEVRQVYGRMLASDEAIALAEQNRSMRQMFANAEEAGMTVAEFAAYQQEGEGARSAALDEMRARVIRDAKYFGNARNRALKAKQKEAREIRAELTMEARAMVMREPVYRAWSILTAKMNADTTISQEKRTWTAELDPARDSLFVAIAKLGGLDAAQAKSEWGFEDSIARPHPHHPVLRKSGGYSLDDMAGMLAEQGYLPPDYDLKDLESRFADEFAGNLQYSNHYQPEMDAAPYVADLAALRLDHDSLIDLGYTPEQIAALGRKVRRKGGVHPDLLAEVLPDADGNPVYDSGDALVQDLLAARPPQEAVRELTDQMMLERFGELSSPAAIAEAADMAAHNDIRLRAIATDAAILAKAVGGQRVLASAAKAVAQQTIANKALKDIRPHQYTRMETRAAKAAEQARRKGDIATAAAEKRNQVLQASLARAAWEAQEEAAKIVRYLKRMEKLNPKVIAIEYREQIEGILERYSLRTPSGKALARTQSLADWVERQREQGIEPDLPAHVLDEMQRTPWQNLNLTELRGLADSIAQIEHLGRLKNRLLANRKQQDYDAVVSHMVGSIVANATRSGIENRTPTTRGDRMKASVKRFLASHRKVAMIARLMDGDTDGGAVTENLITTANRAADRETEWRGQASERLTEILAPLMGRKDLNQKQSFVIRGEKRSFTHQDIFGMALNWGNDGNRQRLLDGEGWTEADIAPLLARLTKAEWLAVQQVWNYIGSFKDDIAAKERRVHGKEPDWVQASPFTQTTADGETITLDGGYYPIKYDTRASETAAQHEEAELAKRQMYGAHTAATTRRSFTKSRVAEVHDRPLRYDLAGVYQGLNDVIHDLSWHEWLIDTNKLLRSKRLTDAIRGHYGADTLDQIKNWVKDIAEGDTQADRKSIEALHTIRKYASVAGLGFNVLSALKQPLGLMQSVARVGGSEVLSSLGQYVAHPLRMTKEARAESSFMRHRAKTRFRELNEVRNALEQKNRVQQFVADYSYILIMAVQQTVDVITWHAQRNKSLAAGASFADANAHADQAVIDSQGSGLVKDLSAIERGNISRLFTVYYGFMNTVYNLEANALAAQKNGMGQKAATILMLAVVMPILDAALSDLLKPGDSGEWDEEDWAKSAGKAVANSLTGHFFALREIQFNGYGYQGPVGLRSIADAHKLIEQAGQGEFDRGFRKAFINTAGSWMGLPAAQINRTWDGAEALLDDKTDNPLAVLFGHQK